MSVDAPNVEKRRRLRRDDDRWFRELIDSLGDLVCRYRPDTTIVYVNRAYSDYFGSTPEAMVGQSYLDFVVPHARADALANTERLRRELTPDQPLALTEHATALVDGEVRWLQWTDRALFDEDGTVTGFVSVGRDVTERRRAEALATYHARHDALTGLANRRNVIEALERLVDGCGAETGGATNTGRRRPVGVLFLDVDGFKAINDTWGHRRGDELLCAVAALLQAELEPDDLAGRLGGDEFVVLCPGVDDPDELCARVDRLHAASAGLPDPVRLSIGAVVAEPDERADDVLHRADHAMYNVKSARRASDQATA